ncbi:asparaginyl-tRNA synthetase [Sporobacter termitidis DSM 10068]|uniref:Asparagine--tRNA ligase n=1 Tax=Sporobacter termitidis DSM 10068 TaxID=1123282 RepID=A0A1M5YTH0_9FIRM|nr:asparaginyl-tRNA synthetase [Sporobacter termitidis DSM 10068]
MIQSGYQLISDLYKMKDDSGAAGKAVNIRGWIRTNRDNGHIGFIELNDGSCFSGCQLVYDMDANGELKEASKYLTGYSIEVSGTFKPTPGAKQPFEVLAQEVLLLGSCDPDFPMQKKRHTLEFMREIPHLRTRTNTFSALFRVRSILCAAIHDYLQQNGFLYITTPIITGNDAEGAGEVFTVTTRNDADYENDFFGKHACMTVSGQLHVEPFALSYGRVYTFGPTFRAENSNTTTHASEFWMIEPELAFADLQDDMAVMEGLIKYCIKTVLEKAAPEMQFFNDLIDKEHTLISRLQAVADSSFKVLTYTEAVECLRESGVDFKYPYDWGCDLKTEHERYICEQVAKGPVFITDYPKDIKAFYMRMNDDGKTVAACDMLVPGVGELIGGSQREERYDHLVKRMSELDIPVEPLKWYVDLRRFGTVKHAGFGVGLERFILYLTGIGNIRDTIPYPRTPGNLTF